MTAVEPPPLPPPAEAEIVTFWDVVGAQFRKNRVAVFALRCLVVLIVLAAAAPLLTMNVPYVMKTPDGLEWTLFERLFDRLLFPGGVDVFFNLLLVFGPLWWLGGKAAARLRERGDTRGMVRFLVPLGVLVLLYGVWATGKRSVFDRLLPLGLLGVGLQFLQAQRARGKVARLRRRVRLETRLGLGVLFVVVFVLLLYEWEYTSKVEVYRQRIAQLEESGTGWALKPPIFYHPDNVGEETALISKRVTRPPSLEYRNLLGTDNNGRDVFARILFGARISLTIGIIAVSIYVVIGCILGGLAGYFGGWVDGIILYVLQVMICIPGLFLLLTIISVFDTRSIFMIMVAIGLTGWPGITRLVRGEFFRQRSIDYVMAAKALGIPQRRIIFGHILKNSLGPVLVAAAFGVAAAILAESTLSFLGLGDTNAPSWGQILTEGRAQRKNWLILSPGMAIFFVVTVLNLVGDGLRDAIDPKLRQ